MQSQIKYQMGYKFYEERKIRFATEVPRIADHLVLKYRGRNNFGVGSFNEAARCVVVWHDCKFKMEQMDIRKVEELLAFLAKPIVEKKASNVRLLPLLKLIE